MIVDPSNNVVALDWAYANADGTLSNQWKLEEPYGNVPLSDVTEATAISWLEEQLPNTADDFDNQIANAKEQVEYQASLKPYIKTETGSFEVVEPEPETPETADI